MGVSNIRLVYHMSDPQTYTLSRRWLSLRIFLNLGFKSQNSGSLTLIWSIQDWDQYDKW